MESLTRSSLLKVLYGALFVVVLPLAIVLWADGAKDAVGLPALHSLFLGVMLIALGVAVMLAGNAYITGQTINVDGGWYMT